MGVGKLHFKCNNLWYIQKDGLAMQASLAVILANLWLKKYEPVLKRVVLQISNPIKDQNDVCPQCQSLLELVSTV